MSEHRPIIVGLGELLWDVFPDERRPGGAPANVAFQAEQLGNQGIVVSRVGADELGDELISFLKSKGLETHGIQRDEAAPTGAVTVQFDERNQPTYVIHEGVAWDRLEFTEELEKIMKSASAVCFGTLAQRESTSRETILKAVQSVQDSCLKVYDVNLRQSYFTPDWIRDSLNLASVVKLNDEEVRVIAPLFNFSSDEVTFGQQVIQEFSPGLVCITRGANGCCLVSADGVVEVDGKPVEVADTVGAGDAFTAGLITSLLRKKTLQETGDFANQVGGIVASHHGAMPELKEKFEELRSSIF
ncbi:putative sugar kinase YdjH [Thalassoglobus neptunius]|uniref:Putative sugar kinase YdjH n=1 Tax=Thalassoglobus neptunius TaxID=1938619 RepID=A0A5C5WPD6_9PLAN|nr:carbohydrate kinase [Thalassoglobus neptunius]TWT51981.1 putative sugar kinase YdjH [Thalassoglobus neptunius]